MESISHVVRTERGWIGHYICGDRCLFRRNTLLECGQRKIVVSTVGAMKDDKTGNFMEIGYKRHFETKAFHAHHAHTLRPWYWDANVRREIQFTTPGSFVGVKRTSDLRANNMHEAVVAELTGKLARGEKL